jgi:hypothetical protein
MEHPARGDIIIISSSIIIIIVIIQESWKHTQHPLKKSKNLTRSKDDMTLCPPNDRLPEERIP